MKLRGFYTKNYLNYQIEKRKKELEETVLLDHNLVKLANIGDTPTGDPEMGEMARVVITDVYLVISTLAQEILRLRNERKYWMERRSPTKRI